MPSHRDARQGACVRHVVVPGLHVCSLAVAAAVPDAVHRVHGVAMPGQPPPEGVVEAEVLGVAV